MPSARDIFVTESPQFFAVGDAQTFTIDFSEIGTPAAVVSCLAYDATGTDKSAIVLSGAAVIVGDTVVTKLFTPASAQLYRIVVLATIGTENFTGIIDITCISPIPALSVTNGYATLAEFKQFAVPEGGSDALDDAVAGQLVTTASRYIDGYTGRTFYARAAETRYFSLPEDDMLMFDDDLVSIDVGGFKNGDGTVIAATEYNLLPKNSSPKYALQLKETTSVYWQPDSSSNEEFVIEVRGSWGYAATAPEDIKAACLMIAAGLYKRRFGENLSATSVITAAGVVVTPQDIPSAAREILNHYRRLV